MSGASGAEAPHYAPPSVEFQTSFLEALAEFHAQGSRLELPADRLADPDEFARYVTALLADVGSPGTAARYVAALTGRAPDVWPDGYVAQSTFWWVGPDEYIGRLSIRHRLTAHLLVDGGNLGYEVRPGARRRGHATAMLAAALPLAAALGIDPARVDCDAGNHASRRVIEKNGGVLDEERDGSLYFWVPTS
jgi:predicted acetyltransferase